MMNFIKKHATYRQISLAFSVANATKDVGYYRQMVTDLGLQSRMSAATDTTWRVAAAAATGWFRNWSTG
jgi:2-hydroxy-3-oxopropionate reductase